MLDSGHDMISRESMDLLHARTLQVLERVGIKVLYEGFYPFLENAGTRVDRSTGIVRFPPALVDSVVEGIRRQIQNGSRQFILNGVICSRTTPALQLKFGGAAIEYLDPLTGEVREPTEQDLIRLIQFGQSLPEVTFVGNPVCHLKDAQGERIPGNLQRIMTAALVAQYTDKYGSNEVWNEEELELLVELGSIVRGGRREFLANPCFVTAKETIAPLVFPREDGRVLYMLAERGLPCTIVPMPISGVTCPVNASSNIVMTAAEVLGVMVCLRSAFPEAMVAGGVISGVMDMRTGSASFAAPEAVRQDVGAALLFERLYGQDFAIGTGYIDALYPSVQSALEIHAKMAAAASIGRHNYPVGLLLGGKRWSPVQAMIGVEMAHYIQEVGRPIAVEADDIPLDLFEEVGIGGNYLGETHTAENFHRSMWMTDLMERTLVADAGTDRMIEKARQRWSEFMKQEIRPAVSEERVREIENWKRTAVRILSK